MRGKENSPGDDSALMRMLDWNAAPRLLGRHEEKEFVMT
jgi:hypothetical protein